MTSKQHVTKKTSAKISFMNFQETKKENPIQEF